MPSDPPIKSEHARAPAARTLGTFELAQLLTSESAPFNLVVALRIEGPVDRKRLRQALDVLQLRHPALALRLVGRPAAARFELGGVPAIPLQTLSRPRETSWIGAVETELSAPFSRTTGPLVRCSLLEPDIGCDRHEIILTFHHVVVDATSASRMVNELLELCGADEPRNSAGESAHELPPAADDRFPSRYRGASRFWPSFRFLAREMTGEIAYRWQTRGHRSRPPALPPGQRARCRILPTALSEADTERLVRATRTRRLTLNSALNAALLLAVVRRRHARTDLPHRFFVFPNLRPYLEPPLPEGCDGSYLTTLRLTVRTTETRDVWDLAAEIQNQVHRTDKHESKFLAALHSAMSMKMVLGQSGYRMSTIALSYTGARTFGPQQGALRLTGIHAFISNLPIGPEYTAQARIFQGKLWLDILYLEADMNEEQARAIANDAQELLLDGTTQETSK